MLNFMIGVIMDTYAYVKQIEKLHIYNERANLNLEFYQLKKYLPWFKMQEQRVIIFSSCKDSDLYEDIGYVDKAEEWLEDIIPKIKKELEFKNSSLDRLIMNVEKIQDQTD